MASAHDKARKQIEKDAAALNARLVREEAEWVNRADRAPDELAAACHREQAANVARLRAMEDAAANDRLEDIERQRRAANG